MVIRAFKSTFDRNFVIRVLKAVVGYISSANDADVPRAYHLQLYLLDEKRWEVDAVKVAHHFLEFVEAIILLSSNFI